MPLLRGDHDRAIPVFEEGLEQARRRGDRIGVYTALYNLAQVALSRNDHELASRMLEEGVALSEEMRDRANLAYFLEGLAVLAGTRGQAERSARLFGAAEGLLLEVGASVYHYYTPNHSLYEGTLTATRSRLGEETFDAAWAEGRAMDFERAAALALQSENGTT